MTATDADIGSNSQLSYALVDGGLGQFRMEGKRYLHCLSAWVVCACAWLHADTHGHKHSHSCDSQVCFTKAKMEIVMVMRNCLPEISICAFGLSVSLADTGLLVTASTLDYETQNLYLLNISVEDHGFPAHRTFTTVEVTITDENDFTPRFDQLDYHKAVLENTKVSTNISSPMVASFTQLPYYDLVFAHWKPSVDALLYVW